MRVVYFAVSCMAVVALFGFSGMETTVAQETPEIPEYEVDCGTPNGQAPLEFVRPQTYTETLEFYCLVQPFLEVDLTGKNLSSAQFRVKSNAVVKIDIDPGLYTRSEMDLDNNVVGEDSFPAEIKTIKFANWDGTEIEVREDDKGLHANDEYLVNSHKCLFDFCFSIGPATENGKLDLPFCLDAGVYTCVTRVHFYVRPYFEDQTQPFDPGDSFGDPCNLPFQVFP